MFHTTDIDNITPTVSLINSSQKRILSRLQKCDTQLDQQESISYAKLESIKSEMKMIADSKHSFGKQEVDGHTSKLIFNLRKEIEEKIEFHEKLINDIDLEEGLAYPSSLESSIISSLSSIPSFTSYNSTPAISSSGQDENDNITTNEENSPKEGSESTTTEGDKSKKMSLKNKEIFSKCFGILGVTFCVLIFVMLLKCIVYILETLF